MNPTPHSSRLERLHDRLTQSKYWSISLAVHAVLIAGLSTLVLIKHAPEEDIFVGEPLPTLITDNAMVIDREERPVERPLDNQIATPTPPLPTAVPPKVWTANPATASGIVVNLPTTFTVPDPGPPVPPPIAKAPTFVPSGMNFRFSKTRDNHIMMPGKGPTPTKDTEQAVIRGLNWLRDHQNVDGSWGQKNQGAMTGLALLSFLGHGETDKSEHYGVAVNKAIQWVLDHGTKAEGRLSMTEGDWGPGNGGVYEHGILTYALGEYFLLSRDERVTELLRQATRHIIEGQGPDGGWMYHYDKTQSDTSVSGWQVQALKVAHLTKLGIPGVDGALDRAMANFDRVQGPQGGYGYRAPGDRYSLSGVGILCELFWKEKREGDMAGGVKFILAHTKTEPVQYAHEKADLYAWYYHTQAMLMYGGGAWIEWEKKFRPMALTSQDRDGSWPMMKAAGHGNLQNDPNLTGGVYRTALNVLMLESYYRYLGLNQANISTDSLRFAAR